MMRALEPLRLNPRRNFTGRSRGERLSKKKGISIEFADYRDYAFGDDLRHLDWNVLARLETPVIKTYHDEEDLALYILLDASRSMTFGEPTKFNAAREAALALGFIGLNSQDAVFPVRLGKLLRTLLPLRSRSAYGKFSAWMSSQEPAEVRPVATLVREFLHAAPRAGVAVLITDGLDAELPRSIGLLAARGFEVWLIQVLSALEIDPDLEGDLKLIDSESGEEVDLTATEQVVAQYRHNLQRHNQALADACRKAGGHYALHQPERDLLRLVEGTLRAEGWLRA
jgi:uncharacterized protein (DUF58 family)